MMMRGTQAQSDRSPFSVGMKEAGTLCMLDGIDCIQLSAAGRGFVGVLIYK